MSFTDEYYALKKKRKKEEENTSTKKSSSFEDQYYELKSQRNTEKEDIAPLFVNKTAALYSAEKIAPVAKAKAKTMTEEQDERKWFQKGEFEDGYQFGDVFKTIIGTTDDITENLMAGVLGMGEAVVDAGAYVAGGVGGLFGADEFKEKTAGFIKKDLYDEKEIAKKIMGVSASSGVLRDLGGSTDTSSLLGDKSDALVQSAGQLAATIGLQAVGVPWFVTSGTVGFGKEAENALNQGATFGQAGASAAVAAGAEILTEKLFGGSGLGETGLIAVDSLTKGISSKVVKALADYGIDVLAEGSEEVISEFFSNLGSSLYREEKMGEILFSEEAIDAYIESFIGGGVLGGVMNASNAVSSVKSGRDYRSGLSVNEQKVVDKEVENRIAEQEKDGKKLTKKEKATIEEAVVRDMERGYIDIDTIEEVLGGESYKTYKRTVESEDALQKEFTELNRMKQSDMTGEQLDRRNELKAQLEDIKQNSKRGMYKSNLSENVFGMVKGDRLAESYNERARRGQAFEADLTKYDTKAQETIKKAVESGILNNTNRTHEFVDMIAKISADKGVLFDFTNNERLKESGFAVDGDAQVNGYVTKDGITLNMDSAKARNSVVGHEITHVLEGTELYTELQSAIVEYAKSKGDYQARYDSLSKLYQNVEGADVNAELTADLVGDYLFTDDDFIRNLSVQHRNVFQKIYDEIKYLCKVATAGSKEARELEKVKRAFEKAYQESGKTEGTKYSVSDSDYTDAVNRGDMETAQRMVDEAAKATGYSVKAYHGTGYDFTVFDKSKQGSNYEDWGRLGKGFYFAPNEKDAKMWAEHSKGGNTKVMPVYLKGDNLLDSYGALPDDLKDTIPSDWDSLTKRLAEKYAYNYIEYMQEFGHDVQEILSSKGYDGVKASDTEYVVFDPEQVKSADAVTYDDNGNVIPLSERFKSENPDIRYSLSDSDGKQLTREQQEYFKDSKVRDEKGNLKVMYHGSQDAGFHVFDAKMSDDDTSFFFVDRNDVAASYSGTSETYEARTIRTAEDMNNFLAEIGYDHYEAVEKNGKFELLENNDHVAWSDTAQGIYEEFCWYEGVGEGDANYKVYLNLKNPLVVDAEGRNWNRLPSEYSKEIYNKYKSLTAEEKTALVELAEWEDWSLFKDEVEMAREGAANGAPDALSSAIGKLMNEQGEINISNLFSIASANFTDEAISENAFEYLKTRDYAKRAKEQGYDGVIFNNIVDVGGYGNGSEGAATVAIAFDSNQIKSVANEKPTADKDIRYSLSESKYADKSYAEITEEQYALNQRERSLEQRKREANSNPELLQAMDDYHSLFSEMRELLPKKNKGTATQAELDRIEEIKALREERMNRVVELQESLGLGEISKEETAIREENEALRVAADAAWKREGAEKENKAIEKSGLSAPEYFRKKALKAFKTTANFNEAGYMLPDGKLLNFSGGERNHRYRDHREIGEIYEATQGTDALNRFLSDGNIRVMAESPGIDIAAGVEPTKEQYAALRRFINSHGTKEGQFFVDFSGEDGRRVGNYAYEGRVIADRVINDIKYYYATGETREQSDIGKFLSLSKKDEEFAPTGSLRELKLETTPVGNTDSNTQPVSNTDSNTVNTEDSDMFPDDLAPMADDPERLNSLTDADAPAENIAPSPTRERIEEKLQTRNTELANNQKLREEARSRYDEKIASLQAQYDAKKNKDTKVANNLLRRIENLKRLRDDVDADYARRIGNIEEKVGKLTEQRDQDHTKADRLENAYKRIDDRLEADKAALTEEFTKRRSEAQEATKYREVYISKKANELYKELRNLRKGVRASNNLSYLLDQAKIWAEDSEVERNDMFNALRTALINVTNSPTTTVNNRSYLESTVRQTLDEDYADQVYEIENMDAEYQQKVEALERAAEKEREEARKAEQRMTRSDLHAGIVGHIKSRFKAKGFDLDEVLKGAKNLSTFSTVDNTPQRVMEKALGYKAGQALSDLTVNKVAQNETEGIKWLNSYTDRKSGLLRKISDQYHIKPGSKESAAAQMYAEGFYVAENNDIIEYGDAELAKDFPDAQVQANIKGLASDPRIRQIYDETLAMINESRTRNAYPEIQKLDNYFLHFRAMDDTFSKLGLPFNPNDIRAKDLPTDLNGVTADLKPGQPYFASAMHRTGKRTSFDLLGGLERYLTSAKNQIYHIDDIQTLRALRNHIADTYGQANGLESLDTLSEEEAQERIEKVYNSHLSTFAKFLNEEANILAGKTALIDRGLEGIIGRRGITFLNTVNRQVGSNMVGYNISSSLTNFLPVAQTFAKTNKFDFVKAFAQTVANKTGSIFGKSDGFAENSPVMIRRKGADRFYRTAWQKVGDPGYALMGAVDDISTELIARTKYNELVRKGMDSQTAHYETDKWVSRLMGDRSLGQMPQIYNSKMLGLVTKFQLEVRNQLDSQFYDTIQETKVSNEHIENALARNGRTAAKVASTFVQLAVVQHLFGKAFESVAGYNPAFDIIEVLMTAFGFDDEEDSEDTALDNIEEGFLALLEDLPYTSTFVDGGRIPISAALPIAELVKGEDEWGNEKSRWETLGEIAPYYALPAGYGQIKKTKAGLDMFSDEHPISGSYTDSGKLRFPVEDTIGNRVKAGIFGQYASKNARDYFDNERKALGEKQIQEYIDLDIPIRDYWEYRDGLSGLSKLGEKADYIDSLDLPIDKKNLLINNIADRKEPIDMTGYGQYDSFEEFDFAVKNPEKYEIAEKVGGYESYMKYKDGMKDMKLAEKAEYIANLNLTAAQKNALINGETDRKEPIDMTGYDTSKYGSFEEFEYASENPGKYGVAKAVGGYDAYTGYSKALGKIEGVDNDGDGRSDTGTRKAKVLDYINGLDLDYGQRIILYRSQYSSKADKQTYNQDIVDYLNSRDDISYEEMEAILKDLDFTVSANGDISW